MKSLLSILLIFLSINNYADSASEAVLYYIPFPVQTYSAVTPDNIKKNAFFKIKFTHDKDISRLRSLLTVTKEGSEFDTNLTRLLVVFSGNKSIMVDRAGHLSDGHQRGALDLRRFNDLKVILSDFEKNEFKNK